MFHTFMSKEKFTVKKRKFGYQVDIVKILLKLWGLLGDTINVWDVLEASSESSGS